MFISDAKSLASNALRVYQQGDFVHAARLFGEAAAGYQSEGSLLDYAEMKNNQSVAFLQAGDAHGSFEAAQGTAAIFLEHGDFRRQGMAHGNEAAALNALGRLGEAASAYQSSADAFEKAGEDQLRASVMQALAGIQLRTGQVMKAMLTMQIGLAGVRQPTLKQKILRGLLRLRV